MIRFNRKASVIFLFASLVIPVADVAGVDVHWLWENRCAECHGHAAEFSRKFLNISDGKLQGRHYVDNLRMFMPNHYLNASEVDAVYNMLIAQVGTPPRFMQECSTCHQTAAQFVRGSLEMRDGVISSRKSGQPVRTFLDHHRQLTPEDVEFYVNLFTRIAGELDRQ